jgi:hypothetical protein
MAAPFPRNGSGGGIVLISGYVFAAVGSVLHGCLLSKLKSNQVPFEWRAHREQIVALSNFDEEKSNLYGKNIKKKFISSACKSGNVYIWQVQEGEEQVKKANPKLAVKRIPREVTGKEMNSTNPHSNMVRKMDWISPTEVIVTYCNGYLALISVDSS